MSESYEAAFFAWETLLGKDRVLRDTKSAQGTLQPGSTEEIEKILGIANKFTIPLYPISTGRNWGYGGKKPTDSMCVIVDLSKMNRILSADPKLGLITVEPGVTMKQVREYLMEHDMPFMVPYVGSGPDGSMVGNALEKGASSTPFTDRFASIRRVRAVLGDGTLYESYLTPEQAFYKWGVGPYIDGLFAQSNIGIVTEATFALAPRPTSAESFYMPLDENRLSDAIDSIRVSLNRLGSALPYICFASAGRIVERNLYKSSVEAAPVWTITGSLQGESAIVRVAHKALKKSLRPLGGTVIFLNNHALKSLFYKLKKGLGMAGSPTSQHMLEALLEITTGTSEERMGYFADNKINLQGLLFAFSLLPLDGEKVSSYAKQARIICKKYDVPFRLAMFNYSDQSLACSLLIEFDPDIPEEKKRAHACYEDIRVAAENNGGFYYRASIDTMDSFFKGKGAFSGAAQKIKQSLDPKGIIAPGRYIK